MRRPIPMMPPINTPEGLHPSTVRLVSEFSRALAVKLRDSQKKYAYVDGWIKPDWEAECRKHLREHMEKGDPVDVAAYCAFMWFHGWSTADVEVEQCR